MIKHDFLIIGSGLAGLTYALKVAKRFPDKSLAVVTKAAANESNTKYAQGGMAVVIDTVTDSYEQHIEDTLKAGDGLCDRDIVEMVVREAPDRLNELLSWGAEFDKNTLGGFDLGREGGHSQNRIVHHKDITGFELEETLLSQVSQCKNIKLLSHHFAVDLITNHHIKEWKGKHDNQCYGAYVLDEKTGKIETYLSKIVLLASGGIGQVYQNTTNPKVATGDGVAMAYRAKASIQHMEFVQFHPTALYDTRPGQTFLISEAVRGFGALLRNKAGALFMETYDERKELASRDIVSRAIDSELKKSGDEHVYLDCRHLEPTSFENHFPNILQKCKELGIDWKKDMIPVVPAAHYLCGGILTDEFGQTQIANLFACGECACTGLHGANRLASNSLLEALIFAHRCYEKSSELIHQKDKIVNVLDWSEAGTTNPKELILITHNRKEVQAIMSNYVGIVRSDQRLNRAMNRLKVLYEETEDLYKKTKISPQLSELRNLITIAYLIVKQSQARTENRGGFYKEG
ncbi:L-aspartate oxidase [Reichenbachiella carrageenanivorans]|uniref:L-aspartate oxidase n=1 Tax=Reichenbachiella carrageenanivorans TaxID=2979869 RepID=A0ABY6D598_9BACT|nr:L-aspartate oxidase [Reichenbachiella carrageenanivorans]UXX81069.1 L-aspartate oxidase [Reichenbachiella carrageenanivorans]